MISLKNKKAFKCFLKKHLNAFIFRKKHQNKTL
jgi:hypothetical protein